MASGAFREDLYHRLNVIRVHVPPLAERRTDIPALAEHFLAAAARELGGEPKTLRPDALRFLQTLDWPGNVRQLENTCNWLTVMAPGREIHIEDLPPELNDAGQAPGGDWQQLLGAWARDKLAEGAKAILEDALPAFERTMIRAALATTSGRKGEAAQLLGWGRNTLTRKLAELDMSPRAGCEKGTRASEDGLEAGNGEDAD